MCYKFEIGKGIDVLLVVTEWRWKLISAGHVIVLGKSKRDLEAVLCKEVFRTRGN